MELDPTFGDQMLGINWQTFSVRIHKEMEQCNSFYGQLKWSNFMIFVFHRRHTPFSGMYLLTWGEWNPRQLRGVSVFRGMHAGSAATVGVFSARA